MSGGKSLKMENVTTLVRSRLSTKLHGVGFIKSYQLHAALCVLKKLHKRVLALMEICDVISKSWNEGLSTILAGLLDYSCYKVGVKSLD